MGLTVDIEGLRAAADGYVKYGDEFKGAVAGGISQCSIPWTSIPLLDLGFKEAYGKAYEAMDLASRALGDVLHTVGLALTRVANHYENNDAANARLFGGRPIVAPASPEPHSMDGGANAGDLVRLGAEGAAAVALVATSLKILIASSVPLGIPFIGIEVALGGAAVLNLRDPLPYFDAYEGWGKVREVLNEAVAKVPQLCNNVVYRGNWQGDGKDAFYACINNDIAPSMAAMKDLNNDMQTSCREAGIALLVSIGGFVAATLTAIGIVESANATAAASAGIATPGAAAAATISLAAWVGFVTELLIDVSAVFGGMAVATSQIGQAYDTLKAFMGGKDHALEAGSLKLRSSELEKMQNWENDWKEPAAG
jgi:hypothetical protein